MNAIFPFLLATLSASAAPVAPLRAPGGPHIADLQPAANPEKPYVALIRTPAARLLRKTVQETGRIFQAGTRYRSMGRFRL